MSALPRRVVPAVLFAAAVIGSAPMASTVGARQTPAARARYRDGWIDLNKNGRQDRYEDPSVEGIPVTANPAFLIDRLRTEYGFKGYVVSDSDAVRYLWTKHHVANDYKDAIRLAVNAGLNVRTEFNPPANFILPLRELVREGAVTVATLDSRVRDVLRVKMIRGRFDHPDVPAILEATFPGEFGGQAIAEALFGDYNPGGRLPFTVPKTIGQLPMNFPTRPGEQSDEKSGGADGVRSVVNGVLYPFGHGLSYTTFRDDNLQIAPKRQTPGGAVGVSVDITNTGRVADDEVVQLYLRDLVSSVITYEQVLRGFERVAVAPRQTRTVTFTLGPDDLQLLDAQMRWVVEPGSFEVQVGNSSAAIRLRDRFEIVR